ncbi:ATP-binding cassette subfamily F protein uup [Cryobacterium sp. MP_3.1]|uniref:ABC transporter ATP-binding protein n=1 Tax=Cryobacterium zongtaii TaxID=1259217 RepID=A0A2S3ZQB4_9MICO|nr:MULTISPECIES: ABC-F family ATP-binding cassette domain-containing protein [Cryobacterium]MEC5183662.1 ATP-binding cassette subfamily F protein uup [Cryobacterium sp. MP_3.1]POH71418.1 ABC transporter ATP-binding protein [Cryobacterium zongtaii]TFC50948.1 ABC transporter ATP-binding protein [Cryobacterium sp. TMB3-1-2]TFC57641.1 ABC transporter ATP-binding protein [Cryobacterium sp. TMB1-7]TFC74294.1 ABC transporter ATP-binding protein [Cryobacterium sp. TMB3-15]
MAHLLGAESLHLEFPTRVIFDSVTAGLNEGDRIGIVGRNGDGKSTLLRLLAGRMEPDSGRVTRRRGVTIGVLDQSDDLVNGQTVGHTIVGGIDEHVWAGDSKVRDVIAGLVRDIPWDTLVDDLSGGQRRRVALAQVLIGDHDVVFLDEPTNHLDVEGIAWLAGHLKNRWAQNSGGLVVVTHDRWFLDEVCNMTWEVHDRLIEPFEGGYAAYILQRVERDRMSAVMEGKRQNLMKKELAWLRRGAPARTAKPKFRIDAANELIENEPPPRDTVSMQSMAMQRLGKDVVDLVDVSVTFGEKTVLNNITWLIAPGERTGILGVNGAGKSTLLNLVAGTLTPDSGKVKRGKTIKVAVLTQQLFELDDIRNDRVSDVIARQRTSYMAGGKEITPGQMLERMGFMSAQLSTQVKDLSGGQKRRLQLLLIVLDEPNVLILDEPTNDLDTDMLAAMEDLLDSFPGTLLVVSHDRYLIERVTDNQYAVSDGGFHHLPGGVDQYLELRKRQVAGGSFTADAASPTSATAKGSGKPALGGAELRNAQKELASIDRKVAKQQAKIKELHNALAAHDQSDYTGLGKLQAEVAAAEDAVAGFETRWVELSVLLEK